MFMQPAVEKLHVGIAQQMENVIRHVLVAQLPQYGLQALLKKSNLYLLYKKGWIKDHGKKTNT